MRLDEFIQGASVDRKKVHGLVQQRNTDLKKVTCWHKGGKEKIQREGETVDKEL